MAVIGGVKVIRGVYATRTNFGGHGGVLAGHGGAAAYTPVIRNVYGIWQSALLAK